MRSMQFSCGPVPLLAVVLMVGLVMFEPSPTPAAAAGGERGDVLLPR
jgi:hypothetical protein